MNKKNYYEKSKDIISNKVKEYLIELNKIATLA